MKKKFLLIILFSLHSFSQGKNYVDYHKKINRAEELFFMKEKADSALYLYDQVLKDYDFVFVKDYINAAQIALYSKRAYIKYIEQGFKQGLKLSHFDAIPLFKKELPKLKKDKKLLRLFVSERKKYLNNIDFDYLNWIYKLTIKDQQNKHQFIKQKDRYYESVQSLCNRIIDSTKVKGFPGDRLVGISDSLIFKEINKPWLDLYEQRKIDSRLFYLTSDENTFSSFFVDIILLHNPCSYDLYEDVFLKEIEKGNLHPRQVGMFYDNYYRFINSMPSHCKEIGRKNMFYLNRFTDYSKWINIKETDELRKRFYITSIELDNIKKEYQLKYGFKLFSGFWSCR